MIERSKLFPGLLLLLLVSMVWLLNSCKKNSNYLEPGISYGITGIEPQIAANGDTIRIYGAGFSTDLTGNALTIHGIPSRIIKADAQVLQAIVPNAPKEGTVEVKTGSKSATATDPFTVESIITGTPAQSIVLSPDHLYLLKGAVHMAKGTTLTIKAGTTILCDKVTAASLIIDDGATILSNGTAAAPVVFASNMSINDRLPGDWTGITLASSSSVPQDQILYTRIEYAGNHIASQPGAALLIDRPVASNKIQFVEAAYSAGDGFRCHAADGSSQYLKYLVAFGCSGNDFAFEGSSRGFGQFLLGIKDAVYAEGLGADGLLVQSSQPVTVSNMTLVGYSDLSRNISGQNPVQTNSLYNTAVNPNSGRGVHVGGFNYNGVVTTGTVQLFNSLVAAEWLAGISMDGPDSWDRYENGGTVVRHTTVTYVPSANPDGSNNIYTTPPPLQGYGFSAENLSSPFSGFIHADTTAQLAAFSQYNDSVRLLMVKGPYTAFPYVDDLGIINMVQYSRLNTPILTPNNGSPLYSGADFSDVKLADPFFDASTLFRGSFGNSDWTKGWGNFNPQLSSYQ